MPTSTRQTTRLDGLLMVALLPLVAVAGLPWWTSHWTALYADAAALHVTAGATAIGLIAGLRRRRGLLIAAVLTTSAAAGRWVPAGLPTWPAATTAAGSDWVLLHANLGAAPDLAALGAVVTQLAPHAVSLQEVRTGTSAALTAAMPGYRQIIAEPRDDTRGVGIWVRQAVKSSQARIQWLGRRDNDTARPVASVQLTHAGNRLQLVGVHTARPRSAATAATQRTELDTLAQRFPDHDRTTVVWLGDFNAVPWSSPVADAAKAAGLRPVRGAAFWAPTWAPRPPLAPGWSALASHIGVPVDFALVARPRDATLSTGTDLGSDHLPLVLRITAP